MSPDTMNAVFEGGGACLLLMNVRRLYLDKKLAGVALAPTIWFNVWGAWNLYYYAKLGQHLSWTAGVGVFLVNTTWVLMAIYYSRKKPSVYIYSNQKLKVESLRYHQGEMLPMILKLSDGTIYRSNSEGVDWYSFPSIELVSKTFGSWLYQEANKEWRAGRCTWFFPEKLDQPQAQLTQAALDDGSWGINRKA